MHFQCSLSDLLPAVNLVEKAVASQNDIPILTGIHIASGTSSVSLTATNLELGIKSEFKAYVNTADKTVVDGKLLAALVRKLPDQPIIFEVVDQQLLITAGNVEFTLNIFNEEDFPQLPEAEQVMFSLPANKLLRMIKNTIYACGKDEHRPFLNGILFEIIDNRLSFVATDINRLAYYAVELNSDVPNMEILVPMKTMQELQRSLPNDDTPINIAFSDKSLIFEYGPNKITTRLIEEQFPKYRGLFPDEEPIRITANRQMLIAAVERAALINTDEGSQIVIFEAVDGVLEISTPSSSKGKSQEKLNVEHQGENGKAAFSAKYILDMLKATDAEQVLFHFNADLRQCLMQADNDEDQKYILMPIRLS